MIGSKFMMKKLILISFNLFIIVFLLSACKLVDNKSSNQTEDTKVNEGILKKLSAETVVDSINNYYKNYYDNYNIRGSLYEGETVDYKVYYAEDNLLLVKFENSKDENHYYDATFRIASDSSIDNYKILDYDNTKYME